MRPLFTRLLWLVLSILLIFGVYRLLTIRPLADTPYFADQPLLVAEAPTLSDSASRSEGFSLANTAYLPVSLADDGLLYINGIAGLSLQEALAAQPVRRAVVLLLQPDLQSVAALLQALDATKAHSRVLAVVDNEALSRMVRVEAPDLATAATSAEAEALLTMQRFRLTAFYRPVAPALLLPQNRLSAPIVRAAHSRGIRVLALSDAAGAETMQPLLDAGLDGWIVAAIPHP